MQRAMEVVRAIGGGQGRQRSPGLLRRVRVPPYVEAGSGTITGHLSREEVG